MEILFMTQGIFWRKSGPLLKGIGIIKGAIHWYLPEFVEYNFLFSYN